MSTLDKSLSPAPSATIIRDTISDSTARIKAERLKREISAWSSSENWKKTIVSVGVRTDISPTKRWRNIISADKKQSHLLTHRFDKKGLRTETLDPKKISKVILYTLYDGEAKAVEEDGSTSSFEDCLLACVSFDRTRSLNPRRSGSHDAEDDTRALLRITRHALQRLFQRGFGLSQNGSIEYQNLLQLFITCRDQVGRAWAGTSPDQPGQQNEIEIIIDDVRLVVKRDAHDDIPTLVTIKPGKRTRIPVKS